MTRLFFPGIVLTVWLSSCLNYRYINTFDSEDVEQAGDSLRFDNDDLIISYDLRDAVLAFSIYNKTDRTIFIDWGQSNFVANDSSFGYFQVNPDFTAINNEIYYKNNPANRTSIGVFSSAKLIDRIPPGASINVDRFEIFVKLFNFRNKSVKEVVRKFSGKSHKFGATNSPLSIQNNLVYSLGQELGDTIEVSNSFWLSEAALMTSAKYRRSYKHDGGKPNSYLLRERRVDGVAIGVAVGIPVLLLAIVYATDPPFPISPYGP